MTKLPHANKVGSLLGRRVGMIFLTNQGYSSDGPFYDFRPRDLHRSVGFSIRTFVGWRHVRSELRLGNFGAALLDEMASATEQQVAVFIGVARSLSEDGGRVHFRINEDVCDFSNPGSWPHKWRTLELNLEHSPLMIDHEDEKDIGSAVIRSAGGVLGMLIPLLPIDDSDDDSDMLLSVGQEGMARRVEVNRYERNRVNRAACISIHGVQCKVCGLDFESHYGEIGQGFIHVHHVIPVSKLGPDYLVDPVRDLIPVCPNCHSMLHTHDPPLSIQDLRRLMKSSR